MDRFLILTATVLGSFFVCGCGAGVAPEIAALRVKLAVMSTSPPAVVVVPAAPAGEKPIADIRKALKDGELKPDQTFVVRARINAGDFPPFADGMAAFVVTDATGHDGDESHNPHECPFCKRDIKNVIARVEFKDKAGALIKTDARELFDVKEFDLLVIEGTGQFAEDDTLVIDATKLFVKR